MAALYNRARFKRQETRGCRKPSAKEDTGQQLLALRSRLIDTNRQAHHVGIKETQMHDGTGPFPSQLDSQWINTYPSLAP